MTMPRRRRLGALAVFAVVGVTALGACSGQSSTSSGAPPAAVAGGEAKAPAPGAADQAAPRSGGQAGDPAAVADAQKIVKTAALTLTVPSVEQAAASIRGIALAAGGQVTGENLTAGSTSAPTARRTGSSGTISLDIPADALDGVLDQVGKLGAVQARTASSKDVTATYVDTESRISTKKASIDRVRALMAQARDVAQIVELESQLAQRESDLESLQATLESLKKRIALSALTVTLSTDPAPVLEEDDDGFLGGLRAGWRAFLSVGNGVLTAVGVLVPFLAVAAVVGLPVLWWLRRRRDGAVRAGSTTPAGGRGAAPLAGPVAAPQGAAGGASQGTAGAAPLAPASGPAAPEAPAAPAAAPTEPER